MVWFWQLESWLLVTFKLVFGRCLGRFVIEHSIKNCIFLLVEKHFLWHDFTVFCFVFVLSYHFVQIFLLWNQFILYLFGLGSPRLNLSIFCPKILQTHKNPNDHCKKHCRKYILNALTVSDSSVWYFICGPVMRKFAMRLIVWSARSRFWWNL